MAYSKLSKNPIQLWLDTPIDGIVGLPMWGNNIPVLLGKNSNRAEEWLNTILLKMQYDLEEWYSLCERVEIFSSDGVEGFAIVVFYRDRVIAKGVL